MRILEIAIGVILLGGAAWTTVRTYKGRGTSSFLILAFGVFLVPWVCFFSLALSEHCSGTLGSAQIGSDESNVERILAYPSNRSKLILDHSVTLAHRRFQLLAVKDCECDRGHS